ncbi:hypothetical protein FHX37_2164 [Haloactinospora alba]|uniref:Uncharacterized protein n=1 Tax=Haloactinospora alba TaxID=405555 RepID=A0A543NK94_9ACTN|nr:hypothetical protein [Haloactinospora alba]TQN32214.1 hypothetical protein FHX37_2164 [Haloactinospora alba]
MDLAFVNGPIQNGLFTFRSAPGKAVGLLAAEALNDLLENPVARHLWNCATLANDLRYRTVRGTLAREAFESDGIRDKYSGSAWEYAAVSTTTDADPEVRILALELISERLSTGDLVISPEDVHVCAVCGHMVGAAAPYMCAACGSGRFRDEKQWHLILTRPTGWPVLDHAEVYGTGRVRHLKTNAAHAPERLVLSRTRGHGIGLDGLGLPGLVLDPRAAVHVTTLAEGRRLGAKRIVMTATPTAIANIAAYGSPFRECAETRLLYGPHCRLPSPAVQLADVSSEDRLRFLFRRWFLPIAALGNTTDIPNTQIPALFAYFRRAYLRSGKTAEDGTGSLQMAIKAGEHRWVMDKEQLAEAVRTLR